MTQQKVVRTYPKGFTNATTALERSLEAGWLVRWANPFDVGNGQQGIEYILERSDANK